MVKLVDEMVNQGFTVAGNKELCEALARKINDNHTYQKYFKEQLKKIDPQTDRIKEYLKQAENVDDGAAVAGGDVVPVAGGDVVPVVDVDAVAGILEEYLQEKSGFKDITELTGIPIAFYDVHPDGENKGKLNLVTVNYNEHLTNDPVRVSPNQNNIPVGSISVVRSEHGSMALVTHKDPKKGLQDLEDLKKEFDVLTLSAERAPLHTAVDFGHIPLAEDATVVTRPTIQARTQQATQAPAAANAPQPSGNGSRQVQRDNVDEFLQAFHERQTLTFTSDDDKNDFIKRFTGKATTSVKPEKSQDGKKTFYKEASGGDIVTQEKGDDGKFKFTDIKKSCTIILKHKDGKGFDLLAFDKDGKLVNHHCEGDKSKSRLDEKWLAGEKEKLSMSLGEDAHVVENTSNALDELARATDPERPVTEAKESKVDYELLEELSSGSARGNPSPKTAAVVPPAGAPGRGSAFDDELAAASLSGYPDPSGSSGHVYTKLTDKPKPQSAPFSPSASPTGATGRGSGGPRI